MFEGPRVRGSEGLKVRGYEGLRIEGCKGARVQRKEHRRPQHQITLAVWEAGRMLHSADLEIVRCTHIAHSQVFF